MDNMSIYHLAKNLDLLIESNLIKKDEDVNPPTPDILKGLRRLVREKSSITVPEMTMDRIEAFEHHSDFKKYRYVYECDITDQIKGKLAPFIISKVACRIVAKEPGPNIRIMPGAVYSFEISLIVSNFKAKPVITRVLGKATYSGGLYKWHPVEINYNIDENTKKTS